METSFLSKSCTIFFIVLRMLLFACFFPSYCCAMQHMVVSSTYASPILNSLVPVELIILKHMCCCTMDHRAVSSIAFHMHVNVPGPCPFPRMRLNFFEEKDLAKTLCPILKKYTVLFSTMVSKFAANSGSPVLL